MKEGTITEAIREHTRKIAEQIVDEWDETRITSHRGYATTVVSEFLQWAFHNHEVDIHKEQSPEPTEVLELTLALAAVGMSDMTDHAKERIKQLLTQNRGKHGN